MFRVAVCELCNYDGRCLSVPRATAAPHLLGRRDQELLLLVKTLPSSLLRDLQNDSIYKTITIIPPEKLLKLY